VEALAGDRGLRRTVTQAELGGQVRKDIERLAPGVRPDLNEAVHAFDDEGIVRILIDGVPTEVRMSPTRTRFVGALPSDVPSDRIARDLAKEHVSFAALPVGDATEVTALAQSLIDISTATPAPVP
jgi:hypothetical protein